MAANRLICLSLIIAILIKNGIALSTIRLESGFKPFFPKIIAPSKTPPTVINGTLERTIPLKTESLDFAASNLANNETELITSASTSDGSVLSNRFGLLGLMPGFSLWRRPFFSNPFAPRPLVPAVPLNPAPPLMPPVPYPDSPILNISSQRGYEAVPKQQPSFGPSTAQKRPVYMHGPLPVPVKASYAINHVMPILEKPNYSRKYPLYPTTVPPNKPVPNNELQRPRDAPTTHLKPNGANIPLQPAIDPRTPTKRQHVSQINSQASTYKKQTVKNVALNGTSNAASHLQVAQQLLSIGLQQPSYKEHYPSALPIISPSQQNEIPKSYASVPANNSYRRAAKSYKLQDANYTENSKDAAPGPAPKTNSDDTPQIYMTLIYANSNYSNYNASDKASYARRPSTYKVSVQDLLNYLAVKNNAPQNTMYEHLNRSPTYAQNSPYGANQPPSIQHAPKTNPGYKNNGTFRAPSLLQNPLMAPMYPVYSVQGQSPPSYYSPLKYPNNPPNYVPQQPPSSYSPPQKSSYAVPGFHSNSPPIRPYMPQQYMHFTPSNVETQNRENYFPNAPEIDPQAGLAPETSAKLLWGAHTFNRALQQLKSPSIQPFGRHLPGADSHNEQFSDCGHTWLSYMEAPVEMADSRNQAVPPVITNKPNGVRGIADGMAIPNHDPFTSISSATTASKDVVDNRHLTDDALEGHHITDSRPHLPEQYANQPLYNPHLPVHGPAPYYLAPYIVTNIRVQSPENANPQNPQIQPIYIPHPPSHFTMIKHGEKLVEEKENTNLKTSEPEIPSLPVSPTFWAGMTRHLDANNEESKIQSWETSTSAPSKPFTSQAPKVTEQILPKPFKFSTMASKTSENPTSTNSFKVLTRAPVRVSRLKTNSTSSKKQAETSTVSSTTKSKNETPGEPFFAQHVPKAVVGHASKTSKS